MTMLRRLETNKLRNVAKLFAHLLHTDALPWTCLEAVRLNEDETTSSSRIFIKILAQELSENMGLTALRTRFNDPYMAATFRYVAVAKWLSRWCTECEVESLLHVL